jgi:uncharacterized DUF497 family protein
VSSIKFDWDHRKAVENLRKHGVSFEEAQTVFVDENALFMADPDDSSREDRFLLLGLSSNISLLVVCHCYREDNGVIRLISARKAERSEQQLYSQRWSK